MAVYEGDIVLMKDLEDARRNLKAAQERESLLHHQCSGQASTITAYQEEVRALKRELDMAKARQAETDRWLKLLELAMRAL